MSSDSILVQLPTECIELTVTAFLSLRDLCSVSQTCRQLHTTAHEPSVWNMLNAAVWAAAASPASSARSDFLSRFERFRTLSAAPLDPSA